jgi:hypothetical protein
LDVVRTESDGDGALSLGLAEASVSGSPGRHARCSSRASVRGTAAETTASTWERKHD